MRFGLRTTTIMIACLGLVACANSKDSCGNKVLALWPNSQNTGYAFQELTLSTLPDIYTLSGSAAKVYYESGFDDAGFSGPVAEPRYTRSDETCVPMDTASSMAVTVYAQFERLMQFEQKLGVLDMLSWPRRVGVDIHVRADNGQTHNNAHYISPGDSIAILPYDIHGGVPIALNLGIVAHEHFHAHFQHQVIEPLDAAMENEFSVNDVLKADLKTARGLNMFVLRSWNEGLADLYGAIYSRSPRLFDVSVPAVKDDRALNAKLAPMLNPQSLINISRTLSNEDMTNLSYGQGALLARLLYQISINSQESSEQFLVRILRGLKKIPTVITKDFSERLIPTEKVVEILLEDVPRDKELCQTLAQALSPQMMNGSFAQCAAL